MTNDTSQYNSSKVNCEKLQTFHCQFELASLYTQALINHIIRKISIYTIYDPAVFLHIPTITYIQTIYNGGQKTMDKNIQDRVSQKVENHKIFFLQVKRLLNPIYTPCKHCLHIQSFSLPRGDNFLSAQFLLRYCANFFTETCSKLVGLCFIWYPQLKSQI